MSLLSSSTRQYKLVWAPWVAVLKVNKIKGYIKAINAFFHQTDKKLPWRPVLTAPGCKHTTVPLTLDLLNLIWSYFVKRMLAFLEWE